MVFPSKKFLPDSYIFTYFIAQPIGPFFTIEPIVGAFFTLSPFLEKGGPYQRWDSYDWQKKGAENDRLDGVTIFMHKQVILHSLSVFLRRLRIPVITEEYEHAAAHAVVGVPQRDYGAIEKEVLVADLKQKE